VTRTINPASSALFAVCIQAELDALNAKEREIRQFEGKSFNAYDAQQQQRRYETAIRRQKDRITAFEALGDDEALRNAQIKLRRLNACYRAFSNATGLRVKHNRLAGTSTHHL
jgi:hypothetical protein